MRPIQIESHVGPDGVLTLRVPMGEGQANARVKVTVEAVTSAAGASSSGDGLDSAGRQRWHQFVEGTYGSCAGLGIERQPQGEFEQRDVIE
jgi:hypothetical protein